MSDMESAQPNPSCGLFVVATGRGDQYRSDVRAPPAETPIMDRQVSFERKELRVIFDLYGAKVAAGEWRDYAIDFLPTKAVFSIFRRASEAPLYRIEKNPALSRRQGAYAVIAASGLVLRRGHELARVVRVLDLKLSLVRD
jgi:hypothetical protein